MSDLPSEAPTRRQKYFWAGGSIVLLIILFVAFSRQGAGPVGKDASDDLAKNSAAAELQRQLQETLDGLRPERLHVSSDEVNIVGDLNLWWADYRKTVSDPDVPDAAGLAGKWFGAEGADVVAADRFSSRDAAHIRNALLYRAAAVALTRDYPNDRQRAIAAFDLVVRHISLMSTFVEPTPLGSFEVLLSGRGTADDRIWLFAEILRQLRIDCVVLETSAAGADATEAATLVAAIVDDEGVLLFDPGLGLAIPAPGDDSGALPMSVVSFREALENDQVFRQFDIPDGPRYPWTSDALRQVKARFVLDSSYAAPRMLSLQAALPAEYTAILFDGPPPSSEKASLDARIAAAGADGLWDAQSVSAWQYPERQMQAFFDAGGEASQDARNRMSTLYGPRLFERQEVEQGQSVVEVDVAVESKRPLRVVRVQHLRGEVPDALKGYGVIRSAPLEAGNAEVHQDAIHWIAVCQQELGRYGAAIDNLTLLLRDYPNGLWSRSARRTMAYCEALRNQPQQAVEMLPQVAEGQTPDFADAFLTRRWLNSLKADSEPTVDSSTPE